MKPLSRYPSGREIFDVEKMRLGTLHDGRKETAPSRFSQITKDEVIFLKVPLVGCLRNNIALKSKNLKEKI